MLNKIYSMKKQDLKYRELITKYLNKNTIKLPRLKLTARLITLLHANVKLKFKGIFCLKYICADIHISTEN